jgi:peptide/nickel transport system substrate-binding protein
LGDTIATVSRFHEFSPDDVNRDPELSDILSHADNTMDESARKQAYAKAFALIGERAYTLPLYSLPNYYIAAKDLRFTPYADGILHFWEMSWK